MEKPKMKKNLVFNLAIILIVVLLVVGIFFVSQSFGMTGKATTSSDPRLTDFQRSRRNEGYACENDKICYMIGANSVYPPALN